MSTESYYKIEPLTELELIKAEVYRLQSIGFSIIYSLGIYLFVSWILFASDQQRIEFIEAAETERLSHFIVLDTNASIGENNNGLYTGDFMYLYDRDKGVEVQCPNSINANIEVEFKNGKWFFPKGSIKLVKKQELIKGIESCVKALLSKKVSNETFALDNVKTWDKTVK